MDGNERRGKRGYTQDNNNEIFIRKQVGLVVSMRMRQKMTNETQNVSQRGFSVLTYVKWACVEGLCVPTAG